MSRSDSDNQEGTFPCPHCGAPVRVGAAACPQCGSDEQTGWATDADTEGAAEPGGYGDDDFDYDEFVEREFDSGKDSRGLVGGWVWVAIVAAVALVVFLLIHSFS